MSAIIRGPVMCGTLGHEERAASHKATWTVYGGGLKSQLLCDECASRALSRGVQRGLRIETLPSFRGVHESGVYVPADSQPEEPTT